MPRINSGRKVINLMRELGTGQSKLEALDAAFPQDKKGRVTGDVKADVVLEKLEELCEEFPTLFTRMTLDKAKSIRDTGEWTPPEQGLLPLDLPVEDFPDDPEPEPEPKSAKRGKKAKESDAE